MEGNIYPIIMISGPGGTVITETFLEKNVITIGRGNQNDIVLPDEAQKISRDHLRLEKRGNEVYAFDLNSRNGTLLNGKKIEGEPAHVKLTTDDELLLGEYTLRIYASMSTSGQLLAATETTNDVETMEYEIQVPKRYGMVLSDLARPEDSPVVSASATARVRREKLSSLSLQSGEQSGVIRKTKSDSKPMLSMPRLFLVLFIVAAGVGWHLEWWQKVYRRIQDENSQEQRELLTGIVVTTLKIENPKKGGKVVLQGSGYVTVRREVNIKAPDDGLIEFVPVRIGEKVEKDQILIQLDQSKAKVALGDSENEINIEKLVYQETKAKQLQAKEKYERMRNRPNLVSQQEMDDAKASCDVLDATLEGCRKKIERAQHKYKMAKIQLEQTVIRAPFDGVIKSKSCEVGEMATKQGPPLMTLIDRSGIGATIEINEAYLSKIFIKQEVELLLTAYPDHKYQGRVREIMPAVDKQKASIPVDVVFMNPDELILPGMQVKASFQEQTLIAQDGSFRISVPIAATRKEGEQTFVWVVGKESKVEKRTITVGKTFENVIEVVNGLNEGDDLIIESDGYLQAGVKVRKAGQ